MEAFEKRELLTTVTPFLQGTAFIDSDANGSRSTSETGLSGATIGLYNSTGTTLIASTTTDSNGNYLFNSSNVTGGLTVNTTYQLKENATGYSNTGAQALSQLDAASVVSANTIQVTVVDPNNVTASFTSPVTPYYNLLYTFNGVQGYSASPTPLNFSLTSSNGTALPGITSLCVGLNDNLNYNTPFKTLDVSQSAFQTGNGGQIAYLYNHYGLALPPTSQLPAANQSLSTQYLQAAVQVAVWELEYGNSLVFTGNGFNGTTSTDVTTILNAATAFINDSVGKSEVSTVLDASLTGVLPGGTATAGGQSLLASQSLNFGNKVQNNGSLSGFVYTDSNNDGVKQNGELGISGVPVTLSTVSGGTTTTVATTSTATDGSYSFGNLPVGSTYQVGIPAVSGYLQGQNSTGTTVLPVASGADTIPGITVTAGQNTPNNNFGEVKPVTVAGTVYADNDNSGTLTSGDTGIGGVKVTLSNSAGTVATTTTAANGTYAFTTTSGGALLAPGTYKITETQPTGYAQGTNTVGTVNATPDGSLVPTDMIGSIVLNSGQSSVGNNFGEIGSSISGTVYVDATGAGLTTANQPPAGSGDTPEAGVTVNLYNSSGNLIGSTVTGANGTYSFNGLPAGTYGVAETVPANQYQTGPNSLVYVLTTSTASPNSTNDNFSNYMACSMTGLSGITYTVTTPSGVTTTVTSLRGNTASGDTVTANFTIAAGASPITLSLVAYQAPGSTFNSGTAYQQVITSSASGTFGPGPHSLTVVEPNSYYQVDFVCGLPITQFGPSGSNVFYGGEGRLIDADNGGSQAYALSTLSGTVYVDNNGNSKLDNGETGLGGINVYLYNSTGTTLLATTTTAANGSYTFNNLTQATYVVAEVPPSGYTGEYPTPGTIGGTSYFNSGTPLEAVTSIALNSNTTATGYNFGQYKLASLSGTVYVDANVNDTLDSGETGLGGITVTLTNASGVVVATTTSASNGTYSFSNLTPGVYSVSEGATPGYNRENANPGTSGGTPWWGAVTGFALNSGTSATGYNFGQYQNASISGTVFVDTNGNGSFGTGDTGLGGITVTLTNASGAVVATTTSASNGSYSFNVSPGTYTITETQPSNYSAEVSNPGSTGGTAGVGVISKVTVTANANSTGNNFGEIGTSISGFKYNDTTGNGLSTTNAPLTGDIPLAGVTINLYNSGGSLVGSTVTASNGGYSFTGLPYGKYTVSEVVPNGQIQTGPTYLGTSTYACPMSDCGFEGVSVGSGWNSYCYNPTGSSWTYSGQSGVTGNGSAFSAWNCSAPQGGQTSFLQSLGSISQQVSNWSAGTYQLSFSAAQRGYNSGSHEDFQVLVDGLVVGSYNPTSTSYQTCTTFPFSVGSGSHLITFKGINSWGGDNTCFLDNICVTQNSGTVVNGSGTQDYYAVTLSAASPNSVNNNFSDFTACNKSAITNVSYKTNGSWWSSSTLNGYTNQGNTVCATFTVTGTTNQTVSLVSYVIPNCNVSGLSQQVEYSLATGSFTPGQHTVSITLPNGYYQVDFVCGAAISQFGPSTSNVSYSGEGRLISADTGGWNVATTCASPLANVQSDLGNVGTPGTLSYNNGCYTLTASGSDFWGNADSGNYVYQTLNGDGELIARVTGLSYTDSWAKAGLQIRQSLDAGSAQASIFASAGNGVVFQDRTTTGGSSNNWSASNSYGCSSTTAVYLKLVRSGNTITSYDSSNGVNWTVVGSDTVNMTQQVYIGLAVTSHNNSAVATASFDSVSTSGYWSSCSGQSLIQSCGGWSGSTSLSSWLAQTYPNLYGCNAGSNNLTGCNNNSVASYCQTLQNQCGAESLECQTLSAALEVYFTSSKWGGSYGKSWGFNTSSNGYCSTMVNTWGNSDAFGGCSSMSVWDMLSSVNNQSCSGILYAGNTNRHQLACNVVYQVSNCGY